MGLKAASLLLVLYHFLRSAHPVPTFPIACSPRAPPFSSIFICTLHTPCHSTADFFPSHFFSLVLRLVVSSSFAFGLSPSSQIWTHGCGLKALVFDTSLVWGRSNASMIAPAMGQGLCPSCLLHWVVFSWVLCCSMEMSKTVGQRTCLNSCPTCKFPSLSFGGIIVHFPFCSIFLLFFGSFRFGKKFGWEVSKTVGYILSSSEGSALGVLQLPQSLCDVPFGHCIKAGLFFGVFLSPRHPCACYPHHTRA